MLGDLLQHSHIEERNHAKKKDQLQYYNLFLPIIQIIPL